MRLLLLFKLTIAIVIVSGCQKNSEKDYWTMDDPIIIIFNENGVFNFQKPEDIINKNLESPKIQYGSHLKFSNISNDVTFDIDTKCKKGNNTFTRITTSEKIFQKLYFYNYLPLELLSSPNDIDILCDFQIVATNTVNSKITYNIKNLTLNTTNSNNVSLTENQKLLTSNDLGYVESVDISDSSKNFVALLDQSDLRTSINRLTLFCSGKEIKNFDNLSGVRDISLSSLLRSRELGVNYFYKSCRILIYTNLSPLTRAQDLNSTDFQVSWSPYFDLVQFKPEISAQIQMLDSSHEYYTNNNNTYSYNFARIDFKNVGHIPVFIKIPDQITANLSISYSTKPTILLSTPSMGFAHDLNHRLLHASKLPNARLREDIVTRINFLKDSTQEENLIDLSLGSSPSVTLQMQKNFRCSINKIRESGLLLKALKSKSIDDAIEVYVLVNNQLEKFPIQLYLSEIISSYGSLKLTNDSEYVFDGFLLTNLKPKSLIEQNHFNETYLNSIDQIFEISNTKNLSELKRFMYNNLSSKQHCRVFE